MYTKKIINDAIIFCFGLIIFLYPSVCFARSIMSPFNGIDLELTDKSHNYSFLVASHLYGSNKTMKISVYPGASVLANIDLFNGSGARFLLSLGDIISYTSELQIKNAKKALFSKIKMPIFNAVGNHCVKNRWMYEKYFGNKTYFDFRYGSELFIILDGELVPGEIEGKQLKYFYNVIEKAKKDSSIRNVLIFSHKVIWAVNNSDYPYFSHHMKKFFGGAGHPAENTFHQRIKPKLVELSQQKTIYWISGEIGTIWSFALFCEKDPKYNIHYIATGIGDNQEDIILRADVSGKTGEIQFTPISLTGQKVYPIEHYNEEFWKEYFQKKPSEECNRDWWDNYGYDPPIIVHKSVKTRLQEAIYNRTYWYGFFSGIILVGLIVCFFRMRNHRCAK